MEVSVGGKRENCIWAAFVFFTMRSSSLGILSSTNFSVGEGKTRQMRCKQIAPYEKNKVDVVSLSRGVSKLFQLRSRNCVTEKRRKSDKNEGNVKAFASWSLSIEFLSASFTDSRSRRREESFFVANKRVTDEWRCRTKSLYNDGGFDERMKQQDKDLCERHVRTDEEDFVAMFIAEKDGEPNQFQLVSHNKLKRKTRGSFKPIKPGVELLKAICVWK